MCLTKLLIVLSCVCLCASFLIENGPLTIGTPVGEITGTLKTVSFEGASYQLQRFLGIPYAEAPVGNLRFRKPIPKARFLTPFNASHEGPNCLQKNGGSNDYTDGTLRYSEDCLILNVYVPFKHQTSPQKYAVMVWIHGGWFDIGTSSDYASDTLSAVNDVIVVTMNYRLGFIGFFSTQDADAPGNYGLWDQHLAIKWVKDNIDSFGGNSGQVTIFGESAGSSSVVHQVFYSGNQGLFQRAIAESGTNSNSWGYAGKTENYNQSMLFAEHLGCTSRDHVTLVYCLRSKSTSEIVHAVNGYDSWSDQPIDHVITATAPIVDNDFVMNDPIELLKENSNVGQTPSRQTFNGIDLLIGANSLDGMLYLRIWARLLNITASGLSHIPRDGFERVIVPNAVEMFTKSAPSTLAVDAAIFEYTDWQCPDDDDKRLLRLAEMTTDFSVWAPTVAVVNAHSASSTASTYLYKFSTRPSSRLAPIPSQLEGPGIANHGEELAFVFGFDQNLFRISLKAYNVTVDTTPSADDMQVSKAMMTMWTNFAKSGDPNRPVDISQYLPSPWLPYNTQTESYLHITPNMTSQSVKQHVAPMAAEFWLKLLPYMNTLQRSP